MKAGVVLFGKDLRIKSVNDYLRLNLYLKILFIGMYSSRIWSPGTYITLLASTRNLRIFL